MMASAPFRPVHQHTHTGEGFVELEPAERSEKGTAFFSWLRKRSFGSAISSLFWGDEARDVPSAMVKPSTGNSQPLKRSLNCEGGVSQCSSTRSKDTTSSPCGHDGDKKDCCQKKISHPVDFLPLELSNLPVCERLKLDHTDSVNDLDALECHLKRTIREFSPDLIVRARPSSNASKELFVHESAEDATCDALFAIFLEGDSMMVHHWNERVLNDDVCRPCSNGLFTKNNSIRLVQTKRTSLKNYETRVSSERRLVDDDHISSEACSMVKWMIHTLLAGIPTRARLVREYQLIPTRYLGSGSTACVCEAKQGDAAQALKVIQSVQVFERESRLLKSISGFEGLPRLVQLIPQYRIIITEPVGHPLHRTRVGDVKLATVFTSVVKGLEGLHLTKGIVHRDVSPGNLILVSDEKLCLIDLGMAQRYSNKERAYSGARSFASDRVCEVLVVDGGNKWVDKAIRFDFEDDLESLVKTVVWTLDREARRLINSRAGSKRLTPAEVLRVWERVWVDTALGRSAFLFLETHLRPMPLKTKNLGEGTERCGFNSPLTTTSRLSSLSLQSTTHQSIATDLIQSPAAASPSAIINDAPQGISDKSRQMYTRVIDWLGGLPIVQPQPAAET